MLTELSLDNKVVFVPETHKYFYEERELISVTTLLNSYMGTFDEKYWSLYKVLKSKGYVVIPYNFIGDGSNTNLISIDNEIIDFNNSFYFDIYSKDIDALLDVWRKKKEVGLSVGTLIHDLIEQSFKSNDSEYSFMKKLLEDLSDWKYISSEEIVYDLEAMVSGKYDLLFVKEYSNQYILVDVKTDKKLNFTNKFQKMKPPVDHLDSCNVNKYRLQMSMYKKFIKDLKGIDVSEMYIFHVVFSDNDNKSINTIEKIVPYRIDPLDDEINVLLSNRKHQIV